MKETDKKLVIYQGVVYNVGEYMETHPGGKDLIEDELGTNIDVKFEDAEHTKSARKIFKDLEIVGKMKNHEDTDASSEGQEAYVTKNGASHMDGDKLHCTRDFDYNRGLWKQIWKCDWSFEEYYTYINEPKVLVNPVRDLRLFDNNIRETLTMTFWWIIPLFWIPVVSLLFYQVQEMSLYLTVAMGFVGFVSWTLIEYLLHRLLFHCEDLGLFPRNTKVYAIHFLVHGIHHAFP